MELLNDPVFKFKYQKYKRRVKLWESNFMEKYGRKPTKHDIKEADVTIKEAYKMYWKLKTEALEETLMDITFNEDIQTNISVKSPQRQTSTKVEEKTLINSNEKDSENIDPTTASLIDEPEIKNLKDVWNTNVCKNADTTVKKKEYLTVNKSSTFQLSRNKFTYTSLKKRNPRKSLNQTKVKKDNKSDETLNESKMKVDVVEEDINKETNIMFGDTFKIVNTESKDNGQSLNTIHQLIQNPILTVNRNINQGWLNRCTNEENLNTNTNTNTTLQRFSNLSDSGTESMESNSPKDLKKPTDDKSLQLSDEEDFICNSDTEEDGKGYKRIRNSNKRQYECDRLIKRPCLETNNVLSNSTLKMNNIETNVIINNTEINNVPKESTLQNVEKEIVQTCDTSKNDQNDCNTDNYDNKDTSLKEKKVRKTRGRKPATKTKNNTTSQKKSNETRPTRRCRIKQKDNEEESIKDSITDDIDNNSIFGIETLEAVPRIAICSSGTGDLITDFSNSVTLLEDSVVSGSSSSVAIDVKGQKSNKEKLEDKIASGKLNDNFVRINLKKKVFVRGKKSFNFSKYKKNQWKQKKKALGSSEDNLDVIDFIEKNGTSCFKCGGTGHFARYCTAMKTDNLLPMIETDELAEYPSLEEAEKMANQNALIAHSKQPSKLPDKPLCTYQEKNMVLTLDDEEYILDEDDFADIMEEEGEEEIEVEMETEKEEVQETPGVHKIPDELIAKLCLPEIKVLSALYPLKEDGSLIDTPKEVFDVLKMFGHQSFRPGQEKAIMRILSGQSTLLTLSTGSGKSLCYQLPAFLYSKYSTCITLVISPLVSLMDDQVTGMASFLSAACLHTNQTPKVRDNVMRLVKDSQIQILLVSPEAIVAGERSTGFGALLRELPPIAFACIDEAHCISQWSHNFRPSYLMVCRVLKEKFGVKTVLSLTATATKSTAESIVQHLDIPDGMAGVISDVPLPNNLFLSVSRDEQRDNALVKLLLSDRFKECYSIIIYCTRREECVRIAGFLRVSLQNAQDVTKANSKISHIAEAYHAGLSSYRRKTVQESFMSGKTRIVVATVAFGMGINKSNIRSVIHYNMPATFEGYVQEVGRAGRDGLPAQCHLFISSQENSDKWELRRHIFANSIDRHTIRRLLAKVFIPCSCAQLNKNAPDKKCSGHEVALPIDEIVRLLDITEETILTLLCYLELYHKKFLTVLSSAYTKAKVSSYNGPQALRLAAQSCPPLAMAIALDLKKGISHEKSTVIEFPVIDVASIIGWDSGVVKKHLKDLEWKTVDGKPKRTAISVHYTTLGLRVKARGDLTEAELDEALDVLVSRTQSREISSLQQLEAVSMAFQKYSVSKINECLTASENIVNMSEGLKNTIRNYFQSDHLNDTVCKTQVKLLNEAQIANDTRSLILSYKDSNFNGRAVARIFHGIQSPNYPAVVWSKCRFWRSYISSDFNAICQIATKEILALR
ncbi:PREDICTED: ATP-dependent DNA helicase Q4 [Polistes dominula]|uniref:DNA 3'-5' helicase n=1 Tax=Polistes dominula TaxID=743375 RepID=A0ABM1IQJ9_POLDO|nr:PREDICTED: ATP-dependent DNA helicase Q4 [Polistes dominula]XP_015182487.1 PREDICTED: ATP-dependent DNA helicase Q4 [Polistes dominula]